MEFKEVVKNRYSCKKYSDRQVEAEKLTAMVTLPMREWSDLTADKRSE